MRSITTYAFLLTGFLLVCASFFLHAQGKREWIRAGDLMMKEGDYVSALNCYSEAFTDDSTNIGLIRKLALASSAARDHCGAAEKYALIFSLQPERNNPQDMIKAALANKQCGDYLKWESLLRKAEQSNGKLGHSLKSILEREVGSIEEVKALLIDMSDVEISNAGSSVNSLYAETGVFRSGDSVLYFSTSGPEVFFSEDFEPEEQVFRLMSAEISGGNPRKVRDLGRRLNDRLYHNVSPALAPGGETMYFTRCEAGRPGKVRCEIWYAKRLRGRWGRARPLDGDVNLPGSSSTHPSIDTVGGREVLYFASDREGGKGGWDLWYSVLKRGRPTSVTNLGAPVNTPFNEWAPRNYGGQEMYFSSDGHPGLGGYDIFFTRGGLGQWKKPVNMKRPFNSPVDDLWFVPSRGKEAGYLVSNRIGALHYAGETCCYDIFEHKPKESPEGGTRKPTAEDSLIVEYRSAAKRINTLLPLELYFDNDYPDPRSTDDTTSTNFMDLLEAYIQREDEFLAGFSAGLAQSEQRAAQDSVRQFFSEQLMPSKEVLGDLAETMIRIVEKGQDLELVVRGYASPLNSSSYNEKLAARRITSLINFLAEYREGALKDYLSGPRPRIVIRRVPVGEIDSGGIVSDDPSDLRNAVYSPAASRERRVSILYGSVEGYTGTREGTTSLEVGTNEEIKLPKSPDERQVVRIRIINTGDIAYHYEGVISNYPDIEVVMSENPLPPGKIAELYVMVRGPLDKNMPALKLSIKGNSRGGAEMLIPVNMEKAGEDE